jgi:hypothetical protein
VTTRNKKSSLREDFSFQSARNPDTKRRGKQDISSVTITSGNKKTSTGEVFCLPCPEQEFYRTHNIVPGIRNEFDLPGLKTGGVVSFLKCQSLRQVDFSNITSVLNGLRRTKTIPETILISLHLHFNLNCSSFVMSYLPTVTVSPDSHLRSST